MFEGVVEIVGAGVAVACFEMGKPMERTSERSGCMHLIVRAELVPDERQTEGVDNVLDGRFKFRVASTRVSVGCRHQAWTIANYLAPGGTHSPDGIIARHANGGRSETVGKELTSFETEQPKEVVIPVDMAIQRRLADAQFSGDAGECECVDAFSIGDSASCRDNDVSVELLAWFILGSCHGTSS